LEFCGRVCTVLAFLRDKSRALAAILVGALNTYSHPMGEGWLPAASAAAQAGGVSVSVPENPKLFLHES